MTGLMLRRLAIELGVIVAIGAFAGTLTARACIAPRLASAMAVAHGSIAAVSLSLRPAHTTASTALVAAPTPSPPALLAEESEAEPEPEPEEEPAPTAPARGNRSRRAPAAPVLPARLARTRAGWQLDLRGGPDLAGLAAGLQLRPVDAAAGGGYVVRARDRAGYLRAAGVARGDVLVAVNGRPVLDADQALDALLALRTARAVSLRFRRGGGHFVVAAEVLR
jgi:hypothetical protein